VNAAHATLIRNGCLFIVSGPSGAGKTSIAAPVLAALDRISMSVSLTTRKPRAGDVHGFRYGTSKLAIDRAISGGHDLLLDVDVQGADQLKQAYPEAVSVFLMPPSRARLEERLRSRGTDDEVTVQRRLEAACREIAAMTSYDYVIVNEYLPAAVEQFLTIVRAERCKVVRLRPEGRQRLLAEFGADR
jgi:guanylate kinase